MNITKRIKTYEPFFNDYYLDTIEFQQYSSTFIKVKSTNPKHEEAHVLICTIFKSDEEVTEVDLEEEANRFAQDSKKANPIFVSYEYYYIEDESHNTIGIDVCFLIYEDTSFKIEGEGLSNYYDGMTFYNNKEYEKAYKCFYEGYQNHDPDCVYALAYLAEEGKGTDKDYNKALQLYKKASDLDNDLASMKVGEMYEDDSLDEPNYQEAQKYFERAATNEYPPAFEALGRLSLLVDNTNYNDAKAYFEKGRDLGDYACSFNLGVMYEQGVGVRQDYTKAYKYYLEAASQGDVAGQMALSILLENGNGCNKDLEESLSWLKEAAEGGYAPAKDTLATKYLYGEGVKEDKKQAYSLCLESANLGYPPAMYHLANYLIIKNDKKDYQEINSLLTKASNQNYGPAIIDLAYYTHKGYYGTKQDDKKAFELYMQGASLKDSVALSCVGACYEEGIGVLKNRLKAMEYYKKAIALGDNQAMYNLAIMYLDGKSTKPYEYDQAIEYLNHCANNNLGLACLTLSELYEDGFQVEKDDDKSFEYLKKAYDLDVKESYERMEKYYLLKGNDEEAFKVIKKAAKEGIPYYQAKLALQYLTPSNKDIFDLDLGIKILEDASNSNNIDALLLLGSIYEEGKLLPKDLKKAINYYNIAAKVGSFDALAYLGFAYLHNEEIKDIDKAFKLATESYNKGSILAIDLLIEINTIQGNIKEVKRLENERGNINEKKYR